MRWRQERRRRELPCVLVDVNTQYDFLAEDGSCPVENRDRTVAGVRRVVAWAKRNCVPVISAVDCHRDGEVRNKNLPPHCIDGTPGQEKVPYTLFGSYVKVEGDNTLAIPVDLFTRYQQVIFRKRTDDFFLNPKADRFISQLRVGEYVIMGQGLEGAVKAIALGLLARNNKVTLIADACGCWDPSKADLACRLMDAKSIRLIEVEDLIRRKLARSIRYPLNSSGQVALRNGLYASVARVSVSDGPGRNGSAGNGSAGNGHRSVPASKSV